jgi:hypothetical protein
MNYLTSQLVSRGWRISFWLIFAASLAFVTSTVSAPAATAQQLKFASLVPSTQLMGATVGSLTVNVDDANGNIVSNSSASITVSITGPDGYSTNRTTSATKGVAVFDFLAAVLTNTGLYQIEATNASLLAAFQVIGIEVAMIPPQGTILAGAWVNPTVTNGPQTVLQLEQDCGRTLALHLHYYDWNDTSFSSTSIFLSPLTNDQERNRIPIVSWMSDVLTNITSGSDDAHITNVAQEIAAYQGPIVVRWFFEMNLIDTNAVPLLGYPTPAGKTTAQQVAIGQSNYIASWRHIRQIFDASGAFNVIWLWNPGGGNDSPPGQTSGGYTDGFYPGDDYVDWIGVDAYDRPTNTFFDTYTSDASYNYPAMAAHNKPLMIGETGAYNSSETNQVAFFDSAAGTLQASFPQYLAMDYFDGQGGQNWNLTSGDPVSGLTEYSKMVNNPYLGAIYVNPLSFGQYPAFSARVHIAPAAIAVLPGTNLPVRISIGGLSTFTPTGLVDIYSDTNFLTRVALTGGAAGYCQVGTTVQLPELGVNNLIAVYAGDTHNAAGQSWPVTVTVVVSPPVFKTINVTGGTVHLVWSTTTNLMYQVQFKTNLTQAAWSNLGGAVAATNVTASATDPVGGNSLRFYRVEMLP